MNTSEQQIRSAITELAADWYIAHRSGPLPESERGAFLSWLKSSPVHIEEYLGVAALDRILPEVTQHPGIPLAALAAMAREDSSVGVVELLPYSRVSTPATAPESAHARLPLASRCSIRRDCARWSSACCGSRALHPRAIIRSFTRPPMVSRELGSCPTAQPCASIPRQR